MKKITLIMMALVLALGLGGVAYASWTDEVVITETVNTGDVLVGIVDTGTDDMGAPGTPGNPGSYLTGDLDPGLDVASGVIADTDKNVAQALSENTGSEVLDSADAATGYYKSITETINNGYPSYAPTVTIEIKNLGTIPVIMDDVTLATVSESPAGMCSFVELWKWQVLESDGTTVISEASNSNWAALDAYLETANLQIEPGDSRFLKLTKHILQDVGEAVCPESGSCTVTETLHFIQWNEAQ